MLGHWLVRAFSECFSWRVTLSAHAGCSGVPLALFAFALENKVARICNSELLKRYANRQVLRLSACTFILVDETFGHPEENLYTYLHMLISFEACVKRTAVHTGSDPRSCNQSEGVSWYQRNHYGRALCVSLPKTCYIWHNFFFFFLHFATTISPRTHR